MKIDNHFSNNFSQEMSEIRLAILEKKSLYEIECIITRLLKDNGDIVNTRFSPHGISLLHYVVSSSANISTTISLIELLVKYDADINIVDNYSQSPLQYACEKIPSCNKYENVDISHIRRLLELGADTSRNPDSRKAPLHLAVKKRNKDLIELLVDFGADIYEKDYRGMTPLDYVSSYSDIAEILLGGRMENIKEPDF